MRTNHHLLLSCVSCPRLFAMVLLSRFPMSCGAVDGCLTPTITPQGDHKEDYADRKARCSTLLVPICDTCRFRYFVGGFLGSRAISLAFLTRYWYQAVTDPDVHDRSMRSWEFRSGDSGFALTAFLVG